MFAPQDFEFDDFDTQIQPEELIQDDEPFVEDGWDGLDGLHVEDEFDGFDEPPFNEDSAPWDEAGDRWEEQEARDYDEYDY